MRELAEQLTANVILLATVGLLPQSSCAAEESSRAAVGIAERTPWTTSRIVGSPDPASPYRVENVFPHLKFEQPTVLTQAPGSDRWYVAELTGKIYSFPHERDIQQDEVDLFIDLTEHIERVQHVYGMTFHPDFERNGYVYICYLQGRGFSGDDRVSRFKVTGDDPPRCDPASERLLLKWPTGGHNGCCLKFGPDGYLYISTGDGASPSPPDPYDTGQDISDFKSSILRIDVDRTEGGRPYAVPADNPFVDHAGARPEIWAYGFRNPWKMSFDSATGDLWVGDIGWDLWEMVFLVKQGGNYGWSLVEGGQPIRTDLEPGPTPIEPPIVIHPRSEFRSITGGFVYRGREFPELEGAYLYGDYVTGQLWGLRYDGEQVTWQQHLADTRFPIIAFAVDHAGELYIVDFGKRRPGNQEEGGAIYRLAPNEAGQANLDFPRTLSETGLYGSVRGGGLAPGVIPYSINAEPWADGARAERAVAIPDLEQLGVYTETRLLLGQRKGAWSFPTNSVLVKTLSLKLATDAGTAATRWHPVETQILHKDGDLWRAYTYAWNEAGTDASLVPAGGAERAFRVADPDSPDGTRQQTWRYFSRNECTLCHSPRAGAVLGFYPQQLDRAHEYEGVVASQLATLSHIGLFADPVESGHNSFVSPHEIGAVLDRRARSYLDVNCAHCHGNGGGGTSQFRLQHELTLEQTGLLSSTLTQGDFGIEKPRIIAPGDPYRSVLYYRMAKLGRGRMPQVGSRVLDEAGLKLIHEWIRHLPDDDAPSSPGESSTTVAAHRPRVQEMLSDSHADPSVLDRLLTTPSGGLLVQHALLSRIFGPEVREEILRAAAAQSNPHIRELFEHFIPEQQRPRPSDFNPTFVLGLEGDSGRGERLFFNDNRLQCKKCHRVGNRGDAVGPELTQIGRKYKPRELLTSVLAPSEKIDPEYVPWVLLTTDGVVHSGLLVERTEKRVVLKDSQGKVIEVPADDIEEMIAQTKSLMPEDALRDISSEDVADLLAYLTSLK